MKEKSISFLLVDKLSSFGFDVQRSIFKQVFVGILGSLKNTFEVIMFSLTGRKKTFSVGGLYRLQFAD